MTRLTVSQVRVVTSVPNVFSIKVMKTAPRGLGTYEMNTSLSLMQRMRAPSTSSGKDSFDGCALRRKVTTCFEPGGSRKDAYGSESTIARNESIARTMVI